MAQRRHGSEDELARDGASGARHGAGSGVWAALNTLRVAVALRFDGTLAGSVGSGMSERKNENETDLVGEFLRIVAGAFKRSAGEVRTSDDAGHRVRLSWKDDDGTHEEVIEGLTVGAICR